jgi:hypothetical protein
MRGASLDEKLFHDALKRIRWSTDRDELAKATRTTLQLMLRRPDDRALLESLLAQIAAITRQLPPGNHPKQGAAVRQAAVRCVVILQSAKRGRLTRAQQDDRRQQRLYRAIMIGAAVAVTAAAIYLVMPVRQLSGNATGEEVAKEIERALTSSRLGLTRHGDITIRATHEHRIVTAERLTPEDCVAAAQRVKNLGALTINSTEVGRPSDEKFVRMCNEMQDASLTVTQTQYRK